VRGFLLTERYNLIKLGSMLRALAGLWRREARFKVTPKAQASAAAWRRLVPYLALIAILASTVIVGLLKLRTATGQFETWAYGVNVVFAGFFLYLLVPGILLALRRREQRGIYRFPQRLDLPVRFRPLGGDDDAWQERFARNLNRFGLSLTLDTPLPRESILELEIPVADRRVRTMASVRWTGTFRHVDAVRHANGLRFDGIRVEDQDAIARHIFWEIAPRHGALMTLTTWAQAQGQPEADRNVAPEVPVFDPIVQPAGRGA
jgi:hypothetical protein